MGDVVPITDTTSAWTPGQALFAAVIDQLAAIGATVPRAAVAVACRHGRAALEDGVDPEAVLAGCLMALRRGKQRYAVDFITEAALVKAGAYVSEGAYRAGLAGRRVANPQLVAWLNGGGR